MIEEGETRFLRVKRLLADSGFRNLAFWNGLLFVVVAGRVEIETQSPFGSPRLLLTREDFSMTLADIRNANPVRVIDLLEGSIASDRLAEMGFLPGTIVQRVGQAPAGDPIVFQVRGLRLAMRRSDAQSIAVEPT